MCRIQKIFLTIADKTKKVLSKRTSSKRRPSAPVLARRCFICRCSIQLSDINREKEGNLWDTAMFACAIHTLEKTAACALFIRSYILIRVMSYRIELTHLGIDTHLSLTCNILYRYPIRSQSPNSRTKLVPVFASDVQNAICRSATLCS